MRHKTFGEVLEFDTCAALLHGAQFQKSFFGVANKYLLSGAAGTRLLNAYSWSQDDPDTTEAELAAHFAHCMTVNENRDLPLLETELPVETDFAIVCRNTFNYFHFITESLSQLSVLDELDFRGRIYFHFPNDAQKQKGFARAFVDALFPELAEQVIFERCPKGYAHVLSAFETSSGFFMEPSVYPAVRRVLPKGDVWSTSAFSRGKQAVVAMNSVTGGLVSLRERALRAIEGRDFSHLPKRFYVGRNDLENRQRRLGGEAVLLEHLSLLGFEYVVFESLSPLEQIALMAQAEVMVSHHGAGFTNMMFANPEATVIEIGTLQTATQRWADFWPLAHVSGCRYVSFFADFDREDALLEPHFATDGIVSAALDTQGVGQVVAYVAALCGVYPDFPTQDGLLRLAQRLLDSGAAEQGLGLLAQNEALTQGNAGLHLLFGADGVVRQTLRSARGDPLGAGPVRAGFPRPLHRLCVEPQLGPICGLRTG